VIGAPSLAVAAVRAAPSTTIVISPRRGLSAEKTAFPVRPASRESSPRRFLEISRTTTADLESPNAVAHRGEGVGQAGARPRRKPSCAIRCAGYPESVVARRHAPGKKSLERENGRWEDPRRKARRSQPMRPAPERLGCRHSGAARTIRKPGSEIAGRARVGDERDLCACGQPLDQFRDALLLVMLKVADGRRANLMTREQLAGPPAYLRMRFRSDSELARSANGAGGKCRRDYRIGVATTYSTPSAVVLFYW